MVMWIQKVQGVRRWYFIMGWLVQISTYFQDIFAISIVTPDCTYVNNFLTN